MTDALYTGTATATGGGRDGHVVTSDNRIDLDVRPPQELGGSGEGTNPEQLVAAGWAACFNGALQLIMKNAGVAVEDTPEIEVSCTLNKDGEGFAISGEITATVFGVEQEQAEELVAKAHQFCPYSRAFRGNVDPKLTVIAK